MSHYPLPNINSKILTASLTNPNNQPECKEKPFLGPILTPGKEFSDLILVEKNSLLAPAPPAIVSPQVFLGQVSSENELETRKEIIEYIVQPGDNLWSIAEDFGISLNTLLWANPDLNSNSVIRTGKPLIISPVSGVIHYVKKGDTIEEIARTYKAKVDNIIAFNELSPAGDIYIGDILVIPDGVMPVVPSPQYAPQWIPLGDSYFICPISAPCRITQGLHWYNAIDFSHGRCGDQIYAVAGGVVLKVAYGWNGGAGNSLTILHPNGVATMYGHLQSILVKMGDNVSQGDMIALMGGQPGTPGAGNSTGCHLHFGVSGARNPFAR